MKLLALIPFLALASADTPAFDETCNGLDCTSFTDNRDCAAFGYDFGWKDEGCDDTPEGGTSFTDFTATGDEVCAANLDGSVEIACSVGGRRLMGNEFNSATITSSQDLIVIIKSSNGGTIYKLPADESPHTLESQQGISHIEFCFSCDTPAPTEAPIQTPTAPTEAPIQSPTAPTEAPIQAPSAPTEAPIQTPTAPTEAPIQAPTPPSPTPEAPTPSPTPGPATSSGDPHFKTWTGDKFDYHGECDLVLVDNPDFADGLGLRVHIRTTRVKYFSYIEKVAVQIGTDVLEFANDVETFLINGKLVGKKQKRKDTLLGGFLVRRDPKALSIRLHQDRAHRESISKIDLHARQNGFPGVVFDGGNTKVFKGSLGLLGDWETGKRIARDGETELAGDDATDFALEWQVRDTEPMLFQDARFPQFPNVCTPPAPMPKRLGMSSFKKEAEKACAHWTHDKEDCIFDVIATRDVLVAEEGFRAHVE